MNLHDVWQLTLDFLPNKSISVQPVQENISTDAGLLIFRQWDQEIRFTQGFAQQLDDWQMQPRSLHTGDGPQPRVWHPRRIRRSERS